MAFGPENLGYRRILLPGVYMDALIQWAWVQSRIGSYGPFRRAAAASASAMAMGPEYLSDESTAMIDPAGRQKLMAASARHTGKDLRSSLLPIIWRASQVDRIIALATDLYSMTVRQKTTAPPAPRIEREEIPESGLGVRRIEHRALTPVPLTAMKR